MENKEIFRKDAVEKMSSPEKLNDYIKVSSVGVWLILGAVTALLAGVVAWGFLYELPEGIRPIEFLLGR